MHISKSPIAERKNKRLTRHGHIRVDPYFWLNQREDKKVLEYLKDENAYTKKVLKPTDKLQKKLFKEITSRIKKDDNTVPYKWNGYYYYSRFLKNKEYQIFCRRKGSMRAKEEILMDVNKLAKGHDYCSAAGFSISPDNKLMAFGVDFTGRRQYTIHVKNLETGKVISDKLTNTSSYGVWANDNKTLFYTAQDPVTLRYHKIMRHRLGTSQKKDLCVYEEKDETFNTGVAKTKSEKYILISSGSTLSDEYRFLDADTPNDEFKIFQKRERGLEYSVSHFKDHFYVMTNLKAKNFRLVKTPVEATGKWHWKEVIPHRENVRLEGFCLFEEYLVVDEREQGLTKLRVLGLFNKKSYYIPFKEETYVAGIGMNPEANSEKLRFSYGSLTTPHAVFDYNMRTKKQKMLKQQKVLGGFKAADYKSERIWARAKDGTKVPISLVYKKGFRKNGKQPVLLYAYGSYGITVDPYFSSSRISLLDRGFAFAIAHIRGGEYLGRPWYEGGKLLNKKNTFTDFIDCAWHLIKQKYTSPEKLFAEGGSAGGLLMGAVANMAPQLFKGMIAAVPFVDVVTTMLDDSIPLTTGEYDEWGNPNKKNYYRYMLSYSPYDNVAKQAYPAMLVTTGLHDSQVQYWEPAKWVAKLRTYKTDDNMLLLHTDMKTGHGGKSGRFERYKEVAMEYAFMLHLSGRE